ncbi:MAG TPA: hypothetical protein VGD99_15125 [Anaerolineae bacterium]|jgi:hypothetical protein
MSKSEQLTFVLWGSGFEEVMAAIFITELRRANRRVKLVGLTRRATGGAYGLALVPDLSLDEARLMAANAAWVIVPYRSSGLSQLQTDPRLPDFFRAAHQARFITGPLAETDRSLFPPDCQRTEIDPGDEGLVGWVRGVVNRLQ